VTVIDDKHSAKVNKDGRVERTHNRKVVIKDTDNFLKLQFSDEKRLLPEVLRKLDEDTDLWAEVDLDIEISLSPRQKDLNYRGDEDEAE
jgi:hypothetical protein